MVLDLESNYELKQFLQEMKDNCRLYPVGEEELWMDLPTDQKAWYFDDGYFGAMLEMQRRWYSTYSVDKFQAELREKLVASLDASVIAEYELERIKDYEQRVLAFIVGSRPGRWELLAEDLGLESTPEAFVVYRGGRSMEEVWAVVEGWQHGYEEILIPHKGLSSWSLLEGDKTSGARNYFLELSYGALFVSEVPMDHTFLDVLIDDGYFAHHGLKEAEIIVGTGDPELEIKAKLNSCRVQVNKQEFGADDAENAVRALKSEGLWPNGHKI